MNGTLSKGKSLKGDSMANHDPDGGMASTLSSVTRRTAEPASPRRTPRWVSRKARWVLEYADLLCIHSVCVDQTFRRQKIGSRYFFVLRFEPSRPFGSSSVLT